MIDFNVTLKDLDGTTVVDKTLDAKGEYHTSECTLGRVAANALLAMTEADKGMTGETKVRRYDLAMRVIRGSVALKAEEVSEIKQAIGKHYAPLIVGQSWKLLDPAE
jgi:hypothetical protein